ncbi:MAG: hypothetical protein A2Y14_05875 [Verrucomicrobia bacterium GWF2_51_19]|nr:MAG: hypothetical protein A2Y14_05875 [Verrucomicrobia bacterium GWF2_51_19]HCJ12178.1 hypothetical protein [Opitutae bacterium]
MTLLEQLADSWRSSGVESGDMLLLHSNISGLLQRVYKRHGVFLKADEVIDSVLLALGSEGTLLLPLFNFDFCAGSPFDIRQTPSQMGALTEAARKRPACVRTGHPVYSFGVLGAKASRFQGLANVSGCGPDSPFAILLAENGKIGALDIDDQHCMTFYHFIEEREHVDYRFSKTFSGAYTDASGNTSQKSFSLYVRKANVETCLSPMEQLLWSRGLYNGHRPNEGNGLRTIPAKTLAEETQVVIRSGQADRFLRSSIFK